MLSFQLALISTTLDKYYRHIGSRILFAARQDDVTRARARIMPSCSAAAADDIMPMINYTAGNTGKNNRRERGQRNGEFTRMSDLLFLHVTARSNINFDCRKRNRK